MTKSVRRAENAALVKKYAREAGFRDSASNAEILFYILSEIGLDPIMEEDGKVIRFRPYDHNYIALSGSEKIKVNAERHELVTRAKNGLQFLQKYGSIKEPQDLSGMTIERCAARILQSEIGNDWREEVAKDIARRYTHEQKGKKSRVPMVQTSYRQISEKSNIQVRVSNRKVHLLARLSDQVLFKNQQITMQKIELPNSVIGGMDGKPVDSLFDQAPYGNAFRDELILRAQITPTGTSILEIESSEQLVTDPT